MTANPSLTVDASATILKSVSASAANNPDLINGDHQLRQYP